jgi:hypothetical protein
MIMKRYLLSFLVIACAFLNKSNAQCKIIDITTSNFRKIQKPNNSGCQAIFDMVIVAQLNNGNKGLWVHFWDLSNYPTTPWNYANGSAPSATFLSTSLGTLGVNNSLTPPQLLSSYPFDPTPPVKMATANTPVVTSTGSGSNTVFTYLFSNVTLDLPSCTIPEIKADVWSTQASSLGSNTKTSCSFPGRSLSIGSLSLGINGPIKRCMGKTTPSALSFDITTDALSSISVTYEIRKDDNNYSTGKPAYDPTTDIAVTTGGPQTVSISATAPFNALYSTLFTGYNNPAEAATNYWIVATYTPANGTPYSIASMNQNQCSNTLPVSFKSFTASRANAANTLKWTTSTEINNKGFYVQRFYNGQWTNVMFVATKAENGNSSSDLNYSANDVFNFKGVVQYRILQVDIDGRSKYSDVRSLSSVSQAGNALVYPNPAATNGNVSIILADATSSYDIHIIDNAGRIVKQFMAVRGNQQVSGLPRGQYMARVMDKVTGESSVDKFIVQ